MKARFRPSFSVSTVLMVTCSKILMQILLGVLGLQRGMVRAEGLEPPHLSTLEPKSSASTNSATPARTPEGCGAYSRRRRVGNPPRAATVVSSSRKETYQCNSCRPSPTIARRETPASRHSPANRTQPAARNAADRSRISMSLRPATTPALSRPRTDLAGRLSARAAPRRRSLRNRASARRNNASARHRTGSDRACRRSPRRPRGRGATARRSSRCS